MNRNEKLPEKEVTKNRDIPLNRLNAYLKALSRFRYESDISTADFLVSLEDVTKRQLMSDSESLGLTWGDKLSILNFVRAVRRRVRKIRLIDKPIYPLLTNLKDEETLIQQLKGFTSNEHANRTEIIETAYDYAVDNHRLFMRGHGIFTKEIVAFRHQIEEAQKIIEKLLGNAIVVHEVGLGKTITAILIMSELLVREPDINILILVPSNLRKLWSDEIKKCSDLPFIIPVKYDPTQLMEAPHILMSIDTAKMPNWADLLSLRKWDLIIIDEGHLLRNENTTRYQFVYSLRARYRLLLTATPVHNSGYDIFHQTNIIHPGYLGRKAVFAENFMSGERKISDPDALQELLKQVVSSRKRKQTDLSFPSREISEVYIEERTNIEKMLYDDVLSLLRGLYRRHLGPAAFIRRPSGAEQGIAQIVLVAMLILRELASHPLSALKTFSTALHNRVMQLSKVTGDTSDLDKLDRILKRYKDISWENGNHSKTQRLIEELPSLVQDHGRVIIYVEFRETQKAIIRRIMNKKLLGLPQHTEIISYHGSLNQDKKIRQEERFNQNDLACFVSTDAGGQGLNLQAGNVVLNFDFPWNPMRVEQRIGRVDRIGQDQEVVVKNFITLGTIEQYVYRTLREKLNVCEDVLGHLVPNIFEFRRINQRYSTHEDVLGIGQIILSSRNDMDLEQKFLALEQDLDEEIDRRMKRWRPQRRWLDE